MRHNVEVEIVPADGGLLIRKRSAADHPVDGVYGILQRDPGDLPAGTDDYLELVHPSRTMRAGAGGATGAPAERATASLPTS